MEVLIFYVSVTLIIGGLLFALPARFSFIRERAKQSSKMRIWIIVVFGIAAFLTSLVVLSHELTIVFSAKNVSLGIDNDPNVDAQVAREIWLRLVFAQPFLQTDFCFSIDEIVCTKATRLSLYSMTHYVYFLLVNCIPAVSCAFMVRYITRDRRKMKHGEL